MPGLLRARRRLRPGQRADPGRRCDGDEWRRSPGRRSGRRSPTWPTGASCSPAPSPGSATPPGPVLPARADGPAGHRGPADRPADRHVEFNEVFFDGARTGAGQRRRRAGRRLAGRDGHARLRARRRRPSASRSASRASSTRSSRPPAATGALDDPVLRDRLVRGVDRAARSCGYNALRTLSAPAGDPGPEASIAKLLLGRAGTAARRAGHGRPRGRRAGRRTATPYELTDAAAAVPVHAAPTRSTAARTRSSATSSPSARSACPARPVPDPGSVARRDVAGRELASAMDGQVRAGHVGRQVAGQEKAGVATSGGTAVRPIGIRPSMAAPPSSP